MKNLMLLTAFLLLSFASFCQSEKFISAMKKNISLVDSASINNKPDAFVDLANTFERIGTSEKNQWLPYYYAAYSRVNYGFMQKNPVNNDAIAEKATALINKADSLQPGNSEISCVKSMIASLQLMLNPQQRYMQYGALSDNLLKKAKEQDPSNPRPYLLKGQNLQYTPEQFGGGCKTAKPQLEIAVEKFKTFKPATEVSPYWGKSYADMLINQCK